MECADSDDQTSVEDHAVHSRSADCRPWAVLSAYTAPSLTSGSSTPRCWPHCPHMQPCGEQGLDAAHPRRPRPSPASPRALTPRGRPTHGRGPRCPAGPWIGQAASTAPRRHLARHWARARRVAARRRPVSLLQDLGSSLVLHRRRWPPSLIEQATSGCRPGATSPKSRSVWSSRIRPSGTGARWRP